MEMIKVLGSPVMGDDGWIVPGSGEREVWVKKVSPASLNDVDSRDGDFTADSLRVHAFSDSGVSDGDTVVIRGKRYKVTRTPWDYGKARFRRPVVQHHSPSFVFYAERGEAVGEEE